MQRCGGVLVILLSCSHLATAQSNTAQEGRQDNLRALVVKFSEQADSQRQQAIGVARRLGIPLRHALPKDRVLELQRFEPGRGPLFYTTYNLDAADTVSTDEVWPGGAAGLTLQGSGMTVGQWDSGAVLAEHPDLYDRVDQVDGVTAISNHSTHVAGTLVGAGTSLLPEARGMASAAELQAYDWNADAAEMAAAALGGLLVSNHSYGIAAGWVYNGQAPPNNWWWIGGAGSEDPNFGYYDNQTRDWDDIAHNAPYYLIVKAAGNDRWDVGPEPGEVYTVVDQDGRFISTDTVPRDADCAPAGYDCLPTVSGAKNVLTVGAVDDVPGGYQPLAGPAAVQMTSFSGWGPTDDGRIKPDLVGNGWMLMSTYGEDPYFAAAIGTSMAAPNVSGSLLLLQEHYQNLHGAGSFMRAATLKALAIHTADETGAADGPDYEFGWGLLNTRRAAELISQDGDGNHQIIEGTLAQGTTDTVPITVSQPDAIVKVTLVWMDPPATPVEPSLDPTDSMLVNDLDLRVDDTVAVYRPWVLNPAAPAEPATTGDNSRDNVEQVVIDGAQSGAYTVQVSHKGTLTGGSQDYSLIISILPPPPTSSGLIIDEDFSGGLPAGWSVHTVRGRSWTIRAHVPGDDRYANGTGGSGNYAMVDNLWANSRTYLRLPNYDMSAVEGATLRFRSYYPTLGDFETLNVDVSYDGGGSWNNIWSHSGFNPFPTYYVRDISGSVAGRSSVMLAFRWDSNNFSAGDLWQIDDVELEVYGGVPPSPPPPPPALELPGQAANPTPPGGAEDLPLDTTLAWTPGQLATSHDVYFGQTGSLGAGDFRVNQPGTSFDPGTLAYGTTYYWRIDEVNGDGTTQGVTWRFTTMADPDAVAPGAASDPTPVDGAAGVGVDTVLTWSADPLASSHDIYLDTDPGFGAPVNVSGNSYAPATLLYDTTYYWRVDEVNSHGTATGPLWLFTTETAPTMHIADLDSQRIDGQRNRWQASVWAEVRDGGGNPLPDATVAGTWSDGASGSGSCITAPDGRCELVKNGLKGTVSSVRFTVSSLSTPGGHAYDAAANTDPDGDSDGTTIDVPSGSGTGGGNTLPTVSILSPVDGSSYASGSSITFSGAASDAEDGDISGGLAWESDLDGPIGSGSGFTAPLSDGTHAINATVTDSGGQSSSTAISVTVGSAPPPGPDITAHVGALDGRGITAPRDRWSAEVAIGVHDADHAPVGNAVVAGTWSGGARGSSSCTTSVDGTCTVSKDNLKSGSAGVTFTVDDITGTGISYDPGGNHAGAITVDSPP
jgi:hypothetical protein